MTKRYVGKFFLTAALVAFVLVGPLYGRDWKIIVVDDQTGHPITNATARLIVSKQEVNPVDTTYLWRREIYKETDRQGCFILQD